MAPSTSLVNMARQVAPSLGLRLKGHIATFDAAINVTSSAVIQVKPGIGDVIWHLPFVRAIAAVSPGRQVTFLAPPSSGARELLAAEPSVAETLYFRHSGSELRRGLNLLLLIARLRRRHFRQIWILDRTTRPAFAAKLAGIPERIGLGLGRQQSYITNPGIDQSHFHDQPIDWLIALMAAMNVPLPTTEPDLPVPAATLAKIGARYTSHLRPWIVLGIGASHPDKDWSDMQWLEFLANLRRRFDGTVFLIGGGQNHARAKSLIEHTSGTAAINACDLALIEAVALLRLADLFIGTDSGPMNLAVAAATDAYALFGATPVLKYSKFIHPIVPEGGPSPGGMKRISLAAVLAQVEPLLSRVKNPK
jgi:heptosyltransferase-2